jgi:hypothetical protein
MSRPYPHLLPKEGLIWYRWQLDHGREWDRFDYDVRVGQGRPVDPNLPDYIQRMNQALTPKRIDAVGWRGTAPTIFEINPHGSRTVYGALKIYQRLFEDTYPEYGVPAIAAVVGEVDPDVLRLWQEDGTPVYVMGPEPPAA